MLYEIKSNKLIEIKEEPFRFETNVESLLSDNLESLFGCKLLAKQFRLENYIFDALAYNADTNAFIIIEYKNVNNSSLVDQGYSYMATLLNRKADAVLLFNRVMNKNNDIKDFDWTQTRMIFVSPKFTDNQKNATSFSDLPFELFEVKKFENSTLFLDEITKNPNIKIKEMTPTITSKEVQSDIAKVAAEVVTYSEEEHVEKGEMHIQELYVKIKEHITQWEGVRIEPKKLYVSFKRKTNFVDIEIQRKAIKMTINMVKGNLVDPQNIASDCSEKGTWGNGDYQVKISDSKNMEEVIALIKQSYKINK